MHRSLWLAIGLTFLSSGCGSRTDQKLNGTGSTFISPLMTRWAKEYQELPKGAPINYESVGSRTGIQRLYTQEFDFACTDAPLNKEQMEKASHSGGDVLHIPLALGAVVAAYNLEGATEPVTFTGQQLADIYLGKIKKWKEVAANLPDKEITVVHRQDGSGTTYIWTDYLAKVSKDWKEKVGVDTAVTWPTGVGRSGNDGVVAEIKKTPGSIGYVDLGHALNAKLTFGLVKNKDDVAVKPGLEAVTAAAQGIKEIPEDLRFSFTNAPGKESYPICGTTWAIFFVKQPAAKKGVLVNFLRWATHEGQKSAQELHYAALPRSLVERIDNKLDQMAGEK
jgi:phosphate ABC transporter phosphate-binding protein